MNVIEMAQAIGLNVTHRDVTGTIDEDKVLLALTELAEADPANRDLFDEAAESVRGSRSAGAEDRPANSMLKRQGEGDTTQLRYRAEMADVFTDLAIDVGIRHNRNLVPAS